MATITGNRAFDLVLSIVEQEKTKNDSIKIEIIFFIVILFSQNASNRNFFQLLN